MATGIHATIAGVILGLAIPASTDKPGHAAPGARMEHALHGWVAFFIMPLFAFANAGVSLTGGNFSMLAISIVAALFIGKQLGIFGASALLIKADLARLPTGASWGTLYATSIIAGIGFTMSLFIGLLAFTDAGQIADVKMGVLAGSGISALVGYFVMKCMLRKVP